MLRRSRGVQPHPDRRNKKLQTALAAARPDSPFARLDGFLLEPLVQT